MNKVMFIGRITKDIELKHIKENDKYVTNFTLAVERPFTNSKGDKLVDFIPVVAWDKNAESLAKYTGKGSLVSVIGRLQMTSFEGKDGVKRHICQIVSQEIQFLQWRRNDRQEENKVEAKEQNKQEKAM